MNETKTRWFESDAAMYALLAFTAMAGTGIASLIWLL